MVLVAAGLAAAGEGAGPARAAGPEAWKALSVPGLAALARQLAAKGPAGQAEREQLGALVASRYAAAAAAGRIDWPAWLDLLGVAGGQVPGEDRQRMVQDIRRELLPNAGVLGRHSAEGLGRICQALAGLGEPALAGETSGAWLGAGGNHKSASPAELAVLVGFLGPPGEGPGAAADALRRRIAEDGHGIIPTVLGGPRLWGGRSLGGRQPPGTEPARR